MKYHITGMTIAFTLLLGAGTLHAQTLYNQNGGVVEVYSSTTSSLTPGWYYSQNGSPLYYYANGAYYDPATQSYGGVVLYPTADGPELGAPILTPGAPNTGVGGKALTMTLALLVSAATAVAGTYYLSRAHLI